MAGPRKFCLNFASVMLPLRRSEGRTSRFTHYRMRRLPKKKKKIKSPRKLVSPLRTGASRLHGVMRLSDHPNPPCRRLHPVLSPTLACCRRHPPWRPASPWHLSPVERTNPPRELRCQLLHRLQLPPDSVAIALPSASKLHARARRVQQRFCPPPCSVLRSA